ncbi:hypothetical protein P3T23_000127 [Paraburkholderia sp. GAS448]
MPGLIKPRHRIVERAIESMPVTHADASACNQLALFGAEFEQRHFAPRAVIE